MTILRLHDYTTTLYSEKLTQHFYFRGIEFCTLHSRFPDITSTSLHELRTRFSITQPYIYYFTSLLASAPPVHETHPIQSTKQQPRSTSTMLFSLPTFRFHFTLRLPQLHIGRHIRRGLIRVILAALFIARAEIRAINVQGMLLSWFRFCPEFRDQAHKAYGAQEGCYAGAWRV